LINDERVAMTVVRSHSTFPTGAYSSFDNNGNYTALGASQTLSWDHENRLASISGGTNESYLYDPDGQRVKKSNSTETVYYASQFYEVKNGVAAKYYFFNGARVATRQGSGPLMYLYSDHLGSTVYTTHDGGTFINEQGYYAYGRYRRGGSLPTDHKFTGQKLDGSGLQYLNARYYNPDSGQFLSPDTIVPDPGNLFDYNRYMYGYGTRCICVATHCGHLDKEGLA
jgi:RHS repeat-associated protein